ncbi:hypothetical protein [Paractinoplanes hotanensis]|nr:hypothetical protein [Actinoplanes hotanensis]
MTDTQIDEARVEAFAGQLLAGFADPVVAADTGFNLVLAARR